MESSFLEDVARSIYNTYGRRITELNIVFPSRRAERYFTIALNNIKCKAKPSFSTIDGVMQRFSGLEKTDDLVLISLLYNIYIEFNPNETFDQFYSFGKLILSDFDSIDKYMVDAKKLYSIVSDTFDVENKFQDSLHQHAYQFWHSFQREKATSHKEQYFLRIWSSLFDIYTKLNKALTENNQAYQGMIYRDAANNILSGNISTDQKYIFVGLNALSESEKIVLSELQKRGSADFIWDFDHEWLENTNNEAAYFITSNLNSYPQAEYFATTNTNNIDPKIDIITTPTAILQCKIAGKKLETIAKNQAVTSLNDKTAIILTDENLLLPLLHSMPEVASTINISIGYPIESTQAYLLIERLIALQNTANEHGFYHTDSLAILNHPYISDKEKANEISALEQYYLKKDQIVSSNDQYGLIFDKIGKGYFDLHRYLIQVIELIINNFITITDDDRYVLNVIHKKLTKLISTIQNCKIELSKSIYISLLKQTLKSEKIPYQGKSGVGVQIMGILETRVLDFENIILLSMNDDNFPNAKAPSSYIPQNLRIAYGLPTINEHSAIWSYYFYRLLQRAKNITLVYCNVSNSITSGEQSRYIYQLLYNSKYKIREYNANFKIDRSIIQSEISIPKTEEIASVLKERFFSPSAINRYVNCPLAFYFSDIANIESEDKTIDNEVTSLDIGSTLHLTMQTLYEKSNTGKKIQNITRSDIKEVIHNVINKTCGAKQNIMAPSIALAKVAILRMVENIVKYDAHKSIDFTIMAMEKPVSCTIAGIKVKGTIDRIDKLEDGSLRIVDYKSGGNRVDCTSIDGLIEGPQKEHNDAVLQILIYSLIVSKNFNHPIIAQLYVARKMNKAELDDPTIKISAEKQSPIQRDVQDELEAKIGKVLTEITNPETPFTQSTNKPDSCIYCQYRPICQI